MKRETYDNMRKFIDNGIDHSLELLYELRKALNGMHHKELNQSDFNWLSDLLFIPDTLIKDIIEESERIEEEWMKRTSDKLKNPHS